MSRKANVSIRYRSNTTMATTSGTTSNIDLLQHPGTVDFIRRYESQQGYSMHRFSDMDWKLVRGVYRMKCKEEEINARKRTRRVVVLDHNVHDLFDESYLIMDRKTKKKSKKSSNYREGCRCPVWMKKSQKPCGNRVKVGQYICGRHNRRTDVPYEWGAEEKNKM